MIIWRKPPEIRYTSILLAFSFLTNSSIPGESLKSNNQHYEKKDWKTFNRISWRNNKNSQTIYLCSWILPFMSQLEDLNHRWSYTVFRYTFYSKCKVLFEKLPHKILHIQWKIFMSILLWRFGQSGCYNNASSENK